MLERPFLLCDSLIAPMAAPSCEWLWRSSADAKCNDPKLDEWKYRSRAFASRRDPPTDWKAIKAVSYTHLTLPTKRIV